MYAQFLDKRAHLIGATSESIENPQELCQKAIGGMHGIPNAVINLAPSFLEYGPDLDFNKLDFLFWLKLDYIVKASVPKRMVLYLATSLPKGILKFLRITSSNVGQRWLMRLPGSGNEIELRPAVSQQGRWYAYGQDGVRSGRGAESSPTQLHTSRGFSENLRRKIRQNPSAFT